MITLRQLLFCLGCLSSFCWSAEEEDEASSLPIPGLSLFSKDSPLRGLSGSEEKFFEILVEGEDQFAFDLFRTLKNQHGNICFSPYSIASGLSLAAVGAKGNTANQIQNALHYSLSLLPLTGNLNDQLALANKSGSQVLLADALWVQKDLPLLAPYKLTVQHELSGSLQFMDFAKEIHKALPEINQWVSRKTKGKVNNLLSPQDVTPRTKLLLTTAIYITGRWAHPFDPQQTKRLAFKPDSKRSWSTSMMQTTSQFNLMKGEKWDMLVLPYLHEDQGPQLVMTIILPKDNTLNELEENFTKENWRQWLSQLKMESVAVTLPSFRFDNRYDLMTALKPLDIFLIFSNEADFSKMTEEKGVFINKAVHKSYAHVDERGTDAIGGGTKAETGTAADAGTPYEFKADHPFLFVVWDQKTGSILLMGRFALP